MIVKKTKDINEIKSILCDPIIYDTISDDNDPNIEDFEPPINDGYLYVGGYVDGKIMALMVYHQYLDGNKCHLQVLRDYRNKYAKLFGSLSLIFGIKKPIYAEVPDLYKNVLEFAKINNFKVISKKNDGYIKNGINYNINVLKYSKDN